MPPAPTYMTHPASRAWRKRTHRSASRPPSARHQISRAMTGRPKTRDWAKRYLYWRMRSWRGSESGVSGVVGIALVEAGDLVAEARHRLRQILDGDGGGVEE